jgi:invasion protein IalB
MKCLFSFLVVMASILTVSAASSQGFRETGRTHQDWREACEADGRGVELCFVYQRLRHQGRTSAILTVGHKPNRQGPVLVVNMPLGAILLPDGLRIQIDNGVEGWTAFQFCGEGGCHAEIEIEPKLLNAMMAGADALLVVSDRNRRAVRLPFSLRGFTAGLRGLRR